MGAVGWKTVLARVLVIISKNGVNKTTTSNNRDNNQIEIFKVLRALKIGTR